MSQMNIIGRMEDDETDERASCEHLASVTIPYEGGAVGKIVAVKYGSTDSEDRGGCVIRITLDNDASSFLPYAKNIDDGVEIHMAGDIEAQTFLAALRGLLAT